MALTAGARLGSYEITALIGKGGMGEVYKARDARLQRDVAIKVLPDLVAGDVDRLARFEREAQVLASLNHPNIATLYGLEESHPSPGSGQAAICALVMELVEGPTLADRIEQCPHVGRVARSGPAEGAGLPVEEALAIAKQIADALEAAHELGIVHRDLKPANIKVRSDGTVKVLDFGLAKLTGPAEAGHYDHRVRSVRLQPDLSQAPTITTPAMTQAGIILGTAAYMSPEQARGKAVDKRADIWAFGCVLYEMLTGRRAFGGDDVSDTIASVLAREPDWPALPASIPPTTMAVLRRCLQKDPRQRARDIGDVALALEGGFGPPMTNAPIPVIEVSQRQRAVLVGAAALLIGAAAVGAAWFVAGDPGVTKPRVSRLQIATSTTTALTINAVERDLAITPDGSRIVYVGDNGTRIFVRALEALEPAAIFRGNPRGPFISPDGQWIGFAEGSSLKKVAVTGGPPVTLTTLDNNGPRGATWGPNDTIVFATSIVATGLQQVVAGEPPMVLTRPDRAQGESDHLWPELLPDGRAVLFTITAVTGGLDAAQVAVLDLQTGARKILVRGGSHAHYLPSGHLVYAATGTLRAVSFDLPTLEVRGTPVPVVPGVMTTNLGGVDAAFGDDGTLAYVSGGGASTARTLMWVDRRGQEEAISAPPRAYTQARLSPEGSRIALDIRDQGQDIWAWDVPRGTLTRLTFDSEADDNPVWTPDGQRLVFRSSRGGEFSVLWRRADGTGGTETIVSASDSDKFPKTISPDGAVLVFMETRAGGVGVGLQALRQVTLNSTRQPTMLLDTAFNENNADISPDGRWVAYSSNESGRDEVYVRPFPDVDRGKWQVSTAGGTRPLWARGGGELFFVDPEGALTGLRVRTTPAFTAGTPQQLLEPRYYVGPARAYDVSSDGQRFLMIKEGGDPDQTAASPQIVVVQNWTEELKRLAPRR